MGGTCCSVLSKPMQIDPHALCVTIDWLEDHANTGDILLFSTNYPTSRCIEWGENTDWSHVGMIVRNPHTHRLYVWESEPGSDGNKDVLRGDHHQSGVRLVSLSKRLNKTRSSINCAGILYRRLFYDNTNNRLEAINRRMIKWEAHEDGKPFTKNFLDMVKSTCTSTEHINPSYDFYSPSSLPTGYFCSQLIVRTYIYLRLVPTKTFRPAEFSPVDFADLYDYQGKLFLAMSSKKCWLERGNPVVIY
jgi:hypothetical protein